MSDNHTHTICVSATRANNQIGNEPVFFDAKSYSHLSEGDPLQTVLGSL